MIEQYRTSKRNHERVKKLNDIDFTKNPNLNLRSIYINSKKEFQTHMGFGGALTRASQLNLETMGQDKANEVLKAYYDKDGLNYNLVRLTINSTDFGEGNYDYLDENSKDLTTFSLKKEELMFKYLNQIKKIADKKIFTLASPWSAPAFMKENNEMNFGATIIKEYMPMWAQYIAKYIIEMKKHGHEVDAITIQNEPEAQQIWESLYLDPYQEAEMVSLISKELKNNSLDTKIIIWDHNKSEMVRRSNVTLYNKEVSDLVWGIGYHWYVDKQFKNIEMVHELFNDKHILFTEGCVELTLQGQDLSTWSHAETYAINIIEGLNNFTEGWFDWNLVLDENGGPTYVDNYCESPIMYDKTKDELIYNPSYYYLAHFSKFIKVGAKRIYSINDCSENIYNVAYKNPNGEIVLIVLNTNWICNLAIKIDDKVVNVVLPPKSITTYIVK